MEQTPRWSLPLLAAGQAQKELYHNEALILIDALLHGQAESADLGAPPADPAIGRCWIVATGASGAWAGQEGSIACWSEGGWRFIAPRAGLEIGLAGSGRRLRYDGAQWREGMTRPDGLYVSDQRVVGTRQVAIPAPSGGATIDAEARGAIAAILTAVRAHGLISE